MEKLRTIIITGGIVSGIGKGITAASIGRLLLERGYSVDPVKIDPYLNQDAGTMNPFQHGEVFVTDDGAETDLDLGHYERFLDQSLSKAANFTSGLVYRTVMDMEREGEYLGKTIQIIPHVTDEIKRRIKLAAVSKPDFLTAEVGGTVGDIEGLPYLEALRQYKEEQRGRCINIHVVKMDYLYPSDEGKTKPIQHSVIALRSYGFQPEILIVRCKRPLTGDERAKISLFTGVPEAMIIPAQDAKSLYAIPENLDKNGLGEAVLSCFGMQARKKATPLQMVPDHTENPWSGIKKNQSAQAGKLKIGLVGKYTDLSDAYLSVIEATHHAGILNQVFTEIVPINADAPLEEVTAQVEQMHGIIVPGGFGNRGIEGKIAAIAWAREHNLPFLGICLGLQTAVIEYTRHILELKNAHSTEFEPETPNPVITYLPGQEKIKQKGGTMRLGTYPAVLKPDTLVWKLYQQYRPEELGHGSTIQERHRHRYEVNPDYHARLEKAGLCLSGMSPDQTLVEFIELPTSKHPYFIATQAHPEFRSRPHRPHPLFAGLVLASKERMAAFQ